jgi:hypothetical protein
MESASERAFASFWPPLPVNLDIVIMVMLFPAIIQILFRLTAQVNSLIIIVSISFYSQPLHAGKVHLSAPDSKGFVPDARGQPLLIPDLPCEIIGEC